ncbi:hypothetical protein P22_0453 [Propionispora sp. 2/2-37]|uniref:AraC family transcriptional regulator n=1 Tax=Propionispora sp. 2/2-37 TaxID=1677858 RepID=UPI0006BB95E9|nr:AraC family transcriptional regulator [Propionispora sp. 2/2-37]CUH94387.1 hypothetical protein P22_0453 [Propionispora sp. 2/2-37]
MKREQAVLDGLQEKNIFTESYPFRLLLNTWENFDWPMHWHHAVELVYPVENNYTATVNNHEYRLSERDILFIAGGDIHGFKTTNNKGNRFFIQFDISTLDVFGQIQNFTPLLSSTRLISRQQDHELHRHLEKQILELINEYDRKSLAYTLSLNARVFDILVLLARSSLNHVDFKNISSNKRFFTLEKLNLAFQFIEKNYQKDISLKDVSCAAGFSEYHFSRIFKELTGHNFLNYLNERRIKKAIKLLTIHDLSIIEVAHHSGFNSIATFNRTFKKIKGCTPLEYKRIQHT